MRISQSDASPLTPNPPVTGATASLLHLYPATMSVIVITGTSTGLGLSIAVNAAKSGMKVYATMRNLAKREGIDSAASSGSSHGVKREESDLNYVSMLLKLVTCV